MNLGGLIKALSELQVIWGEETEVTVMVKKGKSLYYGPPVSVYPPEIKGDKVTIRGGTFNAEEKIDG